MKAFDKGVLLMAMALLFVLYGVLAYQQPTISFEDYVFDDVSARDLYVELPDIVREVIDLEDERYGFSGEYGEELLITGVTIETEYMGTYFITAYCPAECGGSWSTASGETCHRADWEDRYTEPTTCAISRSVHSFGDTFYIPEFDRVFVAEDTGPGVQGYHLDLFYEEYEDVLSFPTSYYDVYSVEVIEFHLLYCEGNPIECINEKFVRG